ncbi:type II secretion system F family protein [Sporosarcina sp. G11-34]|uniref:type II secretion system F family protein n=1 Tax=Sporosarcina sp. G11-34 TaxID=2849605 RepID=UPI0022A91E13|nr:type II secretion system F family protein [Sporosarcina sp. G11-34]MCZ2259821.1 type II secretion system F family protein [Sporosarcina sp. G11-34]
MTIYKYIGRTAAGGFKKGIVDAETEKAAIAKLRRQGINPREIEESKSILHKQISFGAQVKNEDFVVYCRQFATLIRAGISIVEATQILANQTTSKMLKQALFSVEEDIRTGMPFSNAASKHEKVFPPLFINMIQAGEATGNLDETLERLAFFYEKQHTLKKKIQSTLMYPLVLLIITMIVVVFLMLTIVPTFTEMFADFGAELPFITLFVMAISDWIRGFWWIMVIATLVTVFGFHYLFKNNKEFHYRTHYFLLKMPIFGKLLQKAAIARMSRTLSSLFSSSVPILQALSIVERVVGNPVMGQVILESRSSLEKGNTLSAPLKKSWLFPPLVTQMTTIGEETGSLDYMLEKIADFYEADVDRTVDTLKSLIEPLMIVFLAVIVGTIVLAIMVPMFSLYEQI